MNVLALPAFDDNYIWLLHDGTNAAVVDPGDADPVNEALDRLGLRLQAILVTHHHPDHVGGVDELRSRLDGPVFGPARERIPVPFTPLGQCDSFDLLGQRFDVLDVPGHTSGHIAYVTTPPTQASWLFCGDTLFSAGCGRLFEGTPEQMHESLNKLAALPANTQVFCTHEYTLSNLRFAQAVEPGNVAVQDAVRRCTELREKGNITLPSSLGEELRINPFLRCGEPAVVAAASAHGASGPSKLAVFTALREWKNVFR